MDSQGKIKKFFIENSGRSFVYTGEVLSENENFYTINDKKLGNISLNKKNVVMIQEVVG